jgi:uncharacterized protein YyaL (SSP411 family)
VGAWRVLLILLSGLSAGAAAQAQSVPAQEVRAALIEITDAMATRLMDDQGRARGDYHWATGEWREYEAAWHTGQMIEALLAAHEATGDPRYLARARQAGEWWIALELKDGPFKGMINAAHGDRLGQLINFTTVGNGTSGLFRLSHITGDPRFADVATAAIIWLAKNTNVPGHPGLYYNILDPATGTIWTGKSPHHDVEKASVEQVARPNIEGSPFLDACQHSGEQWLCEAHIDLARHTAARQSANGFWMEFEPNDPVTGTIHPRFNTWNAEAMLRTHRATGEQRLLDAALATARANAALMEADGRFDYEQNVSGKSGRNAPTGSATAFAGLLWLDLHLMGHTEYEPQIHAAARWLIANRFPADHPDPNLRGLVKELRVKNGQVIQRDLGNPFAARFLAAYLKAFPQ